MCELIEPFPCHLLVDRQPIQMVLPNAIRPSLNAAQDIPTPVTGLRPSTEWFKCDVSLVTPFVPVVGCSSSGRAALAHLRTSPGTFSTENRVDRDFENDVLGRADRAADDDISVRDPFN
jgi:hypothetical protein